MEKFKYPSTPHIQKSKSVTKDDIISDYYDFVGMDIVITEKMDGEQPWWESDMNYLSDEDIYYWVCNNIKVSYENKINSKSKNNLQVWIYSI